MLFKKLAIFLIALVTVAAFGMIQGCSESEKVVESVNENESGVSERVRILPVGDIEQPNYEEYLDLPFDTIVFEGDFDPEIIKANDPSQFFGEAAHKAAVGNYNSFPWGFNLPFIACRRMTCGYGCGRHTVYEYYATDWSNGYCNSDIKAPGAGWVKWTGYKGDWGNTVILECGPTGLPDGRRYIVRLSHLSRIDVRAGWWLPKGWRVGKVGSTGYSTGCHIHWTVLRGFYAGYGNVNGWSFPPSYSSGVDGFNGGYRTWCSEFR